MFSFECFHTNCPTVHSWVLTGPITVSKVLWANSSPSGWWSNCCAFLYFVNNVRKDCCTLKHWLVTMQSMFFLLWYNPRDATPLICSTHVRIRAPQQSEDSALQARHGSPDGSAQGFVPGICTCLFISAKVRVPQRTVASCCILA